MLKVYTAMLTNANTRAAYTKDLGYFEEWLANQAVSLNSLKPSVLTAFRTHLVARFKPATVNRY